MSIDRTPVEQAQALRKALLSDYHATFMSEPGRRVLLDLERAAFVGRTTLERPAGQAVDMLATVYNEGQRAAVLRIKARIAEAQLGHDPSYTYAVSSTASQEE